MEEQFKSIIRQFVIKGVPVEVKPLGNGLINDTFKVLTSGYDPDYVLQRINHEVFKDVTFHEMNVPVIFNCTGKELEDCSVQEMLEKQVMSPVYFEDSIRTMINNGVDTIIEIGPGKVLSGFVRKIDRKIKTYQVEDMASLQKCVEALNETK